MGFANFKGNFWPQMFEEVSFPCELYSYLVLLQVIFIFWPY